MDHVYCGLIYKEGDTMNPNTYRTIIIGHTLAKWYDTVMEVELSRFIAIMGLMQQNKQNLEEVSQLLLIFLY